MENEPNSLKDLARSAGDNWIFEDLRERSEDSSEMDHRTLIRKNECKCYFGEDDIIIENFRLKNAGIPGKNTKRLGNYFKYRNGNL